MDHLWPVDGCWMPNSGRIVLDGWASYRDSIPIEAEEAELEREWMLDSIAGVRITREGL